LIEPKNQAIEHSNIIKGDATLIVFCSILARVEKVSDFSIAELQTGNACWQLQTSNWRRRTTF
jgi:hypothetical protein